MEYTLQEHPQLFTRRKNKHVNMPNLEEGYKKGY